MPRAAFPGRKLLIVSLVSVAVLLIAAWLAGPPREPVHQGQQLSALVFWPYRLGPPGEPSTWSTRVRAFGPESIAWLAYLIEHGRRSGPRPFDSAPTWLRRGLPERWGGISSYSNEVDQRDSAAIALMQFGPEAAPAIPALRRSLDGPYPPSHAAMALNVIGPAAWPAAEDALIHGNENLRCSILESLWYSMFYNNRTPSEGEKERVRAIYRLACADPDINVRLLMATKITGFRSAGVPLPFDSPPAELIAILTDSALVVRRNAINMMTNFRAKAIPPLLELLDNPTADIRSAAAQALGYLYGEARKSDVTVAGLRAMLKDPDSTCRQAAEDALRRLEVSRTAENTAPPARQP